MPKQTFIEDDKEYIFWIETFNPHSNSLWFKLYKNGFRKILRLKINSTPFPSLFDKTKFFPIINDKILWAYYQKRFGILDLSIRTKIEKYLKMKIFD